jgi:trigger factor
MEKKFKKADHANYDIELSFTSAEQDEAKSTMLKHFQKDFEMPGFRKGNAPMDVVEKNTKPEYLSAGIYEHLINKGLQELIKEEPSLRLIGEPYEFKQTVNGDVTTVTFKLDIFPDVEILNKDREKETIRHIHPEAGAEEVENAITSLKKNYADYQDADSVALDTITKVAMEFLDAEGKSIDKGHNYVGEQEFAEDPFYAKTFVGKTKGEEFEIPYKEKELPAVYHNKKADTKAHSIKITIQDIKKIVLPALDEANIQKFFGQETEVKTEAQLRDFIERNIIQQKFETELVQEIEKLLQTVKAKSMKVAIPKTLVDEEFATRMKSLQERFGGAEKIQEYFKKIGEEEGKKFIDDIKKAAEDSLEKFFILQKIVEGLGLDINWEKPGHLEIELKLYEKLGKGHEHHEHANHEHHEHHEEEKKPAKKAPAKKAK